MHAPIHIVGGVRLHSFFILENVMCMKLGVSYFSSCLT